MDLDALLFVAGMVTRQRVPAPLAPPSLALLLIVLEIDLSNSHGNDQYLEPSDRLRCLLGNERLRHDASGTRFARKDSHVAVSDRGHLLSRLLVHVSHVHVPFGIGGQVLRPAGLFRDLLADRVFLHPLPLLRILLPSPNEDILHRSGRRFGNRLRHRHSVGEVLAASLSTVPRRRLRGVGSVRDRAHHPLHDVPWLRDDHLRGLVHLLDADGCSVPVRRRLIRHEDPRKVFPWKMRRGVPKPPTHALARGHRSVRALPRNLGNGSETSLRFV